MNEILSRQEDGSNTRKKILPIAAPLQRVIKEGSVTIIDARGNVHRFGQGHSDLRATIRLHRRVLGWTLLHNTELRFAEAYMDGTITIEEGTLRDLIEIVALNSRNGSLSPWDVSTRWLLPLRRALQQHNPIARSRANVAHHYDLSSTLYDLFLGKYRQYSCAYFRHPGETLEAAQRNKMQHLAGKLLIKPGMQVLDIGSGWGGLALYLARTTGAHVTGLTLSAEQHRYACRQALQAGLADRVSFYLRDYREETGEYDRIVSVGMFEHVGVRHYREFFTKIVRHFILAASRYSMRSAAWTGRERHRSGCASTFFLAGMRLRFPKFFRTSRRPVCGRPISRYFGCITLPRYESGTAASPPIAPALDSFTMNAFAECGSYICWAAKCSSDT